MKISIITICYNNAKELKSAIDSVLGQSYEDIEYIIVDGGSCDGTQELVESYGNRIAKYTSEPDKGIYDALNKGINLATGDFIGFMHSDDIYAHADVIKDVVEALKKNNSQAIYSDLQYVDKNDTSLIKRFWTSGEYQKAKLKKGWMPPHPTLFLHKDIYQLAKLPSGEYFDTSMKIAADYDFMVRILNKYDISPIYLPQVTVKMRVGGASNRNLKALINKSKEDMRVMRRNGLNPWTTLFFKNFKIFKQIFKK
ncbi:glycosyltransferase family 2 protein [Lentisphaera profundi]|uniref:Glycosyltransferase family 2 protein n=1 Tax=Lentisphaera profundi TaxID=1658616 RepID=A0ABY7VWD8_9BACT|nr:glycosyltransferase family 2 protein [Lentisphaera profundi]WDE98221.1 glycosyltransferase family 2 protein [Lentisphaera profundi]